MTAAKPHRCTEACKCPACGSDMFYAPATNSRRGEHACVDPVCVFAVGERDAMRQWAVPHLVERAEGAATLAGRLRECAADFREISGTF